MNIITNKPSMNYSDSEKILDEILRLKDKFPPQKIGKFVKKTYNDLFPEIKDYINSIRKGKVDIKNIDIIITGGVNDFSRICCFRGYNIYIKTASAFYDDDYNTIVINYPYLLLDIFTVEKYGFDYKDRIREMMAHEISEAFVTNSIFPEYLEIEYLKNFSKKYNLPEELVIQFVHLKRHNLVTWLATKILKKKGYKKSVELENRLNNLLHNIGKLSYEIVWEDLKEKDFEKMINNHVLEISTEIEKETLRKLKLSSDATDALCEESSKQFEEDIKKPELKKIIQYYNLNTFLYFLWKSVNAITMKKYGKAYENLVYIENYIKDIKGLNRNLGDNLEYVHKVLKGFSGFYYGLENNMLDLIVESKEILYKAFKDPLKVQYFTIINPNALLKNIVEYLKGFGVVEYSGILDDLF